MDEVEWVPGSVLQFENPYYKCLGMQTTKSFLVLIYKFFEMDAYTSSSLCTEGGGRYLSSGRGMGVEE